MISQSPQHQCPSENPARTLDKLLMCNLKDAAARQERGSQVRTSQVSLRSSRTGSFNIACYRNFSFRFQYMKSLLPLWRVWRKDRPPPVQVATHFSVWVQHQATVHQQISSRVPGIEKSCSTGILLIFK